MRKAQRDHGGNLDAAIRRYGGNRGDWLDLSTGINPVPYPLPPVSDDAWAALPRRADLDQFCNLAAEAYGTSAAVIPFTGAQAAIQSIPHLQRTPGRAAIVSPTYNEHAHALTLGGWDVSEVPSIRDAEAADLAVVVNPNNPDGRLWTPDALRALARTVALLIVDESFADPAPETSLAPDMPENAVILRSFGKFYGLAGLRLGFALAHPPLAERLGDLAGPWPISGPAMEIGQAAFSDDAWRAETITRLRRDAETLDGLATQQGWTLVGGTTLFRTYATEDAARVQDRLAQSKTWSRVFPYAPDWIRLGLPRPDQWDQLENAIRACG